MMGRSKKGGPLKGRFHAAAHTDDADTAIVSVTLSKDIGELLAGATITHCILGAATFPRYAYFDNGDRTIPVPVAYEAVITHIPKLKFPIVITTDDVAKAYTEDATAGA